MPTQPVAGGGLSGRATTLFAVAAGLAVANIYYAQPLLTDIAHTFGVGSGRASLIVTVTSIGYAAGLALVVPLGDVLRRRRLVVTMLLVVAVAQAASACAPSIGWLTGFSALLAVCAGVAPLLVAFAATLATPDQRGSVTGRVMGGTLTGVLLARAGGGLIAEFFGGWRTVYAVAAVLMVVLALVLHRALPDLAPGARLRYPTLLRSTAALLREEPLLRLRCAYGFLSFAGFSALWASLAFLLAGAPYHYGEAAIGLVGLAGAAGALAAPLAGRLIDRGHERRATGLLMVCILAGWGLTAIAGGRVTATLLLGIILLDLGVQGLQTTNLSVIYALRPEARNRVTTAYTVTYFLGGFAGAAVSGVAYDRAGWSGVCVAGAVFAVLALLLRLVAARREQRARVRGGTVAD